MKETETNNLLKGKGWMRWCITIKRVHTDVHRMTRKRKKIRPLIRVCLVIYRRHEWGMDILFNDVWEYHNEKIQETKINKKNFSIFNFLLLPFREIVWSECIIFSAKRLKINIYAILENWLDVYFFLNDLCALL